MPRKPPPKNSRLDEVIRKVPASGALDAIITFHDKTGLRKLDGLRVPTRELETLAIANAHLTPDQVREVASWRETRSIRPNAALQLYLHDSTAQIRATQVWAKQGIGVKATGDGVGIAIVDTGVDGTHPDLPFPAKVKMNRVVSGLSALGGPRLPLLADVPHTDSEVGHGTHCAGIAAGFGAASHDTRRGVAYHASIYSFRISAGDRVLVFAALEAFDHILAMVEEDRKAGKPPRIRVISNSWGGGDGADHDADDPLSIFAKAFYDRGVVVVYAAGNSGGPDRLSQQATSPHVVAVGAVTKPLPDRPAAGPELGTRVAKADFSSTGRPGGPWTRGPQGTYRPTVMAPGVDIHAPRSTTAPIMSQSVDLANPFYTVADGTSMAAPHVAGVVALMFELNPDLTAQEVINILERTGTPLPNYDTWEQGAGIVDALEACKAALAKDTRPWLGPSYAYIERRSQDISGKVLPATYALRDQVPAVVERVPFTVKPGEYALHARVAWDAPGQAPTGGFLQPYNIYLFLYDPQGRLAASSAGLGDTGFAGEREVMVTHAEPGVWTLTIEGRVNGPTAYRGKFTVYDKVAGK